MTGISHCRTANYRMSFVCLLLIALAGCPAPTPGERIRQLKGTVVHKANGVINVDLSNTSLSDDDFEYVHGCCTNEGYKSIHTLNLTNTSITDQFLHHMRLQQGHFTSESGLQELILTGTNTSDEAVQKYQAVDPDCRIIR